MEKGITNRILNPFLEGLKEGGASVELFYIKKQKIKPCLGDLKCWNETPGECFIQDDMQTIYPKLYEANILVIATPVYIPFPAAVQNFLNRIVPLITPSLEFHKGRTRAKFRENVSITKIILVSTSGWWELANFDRVVHIIEDLAQTVGVEFSGSLLRPHARLMDEMPEKTKEILNAAKEAGYQLAKKGKISPENLEFISQPLISQEELWKRRSK